MVGDHTRPMICSSELGMDDVAVPRATHRREDLGDGCVILLESGKIVTLSESATAIFDALDGARTVEQAAGFVAASYQVDRAIVEATMVSTLRRFAALGLLENVAVDQTDQPVDEGPAEPPRLDESGEQPCGSGDPARVPEHLVRRGLPDPASCLGRRLHLADAEFIDIATPWFTMGIAVSGAGLATHLGRLFEPCASDEETGVGLAVVGRAGPLKHARPIYTILDGTGYRAWRGRRIRDVESALLAILSPPAVDPARRRAFVDFRALRRDGQVLLVHPYVLDDVRLMKECQQAGWEVGGPLMTEIDVDTGKALRRESFVPMDPGRAPAALAAEPIVGLLFGTSPQGEADIDALAALLGRHLELVDGVTSVAAMPTYAQLVRTIPVVAAAEPSRTLYLDAFMRLQAAIR